MRQCVKRSKQGKTYTEQETQLDGFIKIMNVSHKISEKNSTRIIQESVKVRVSLNYHFWYRSELDYEVLSSRKKEEGNPAEKKGKRRLTYHLHFRSSQSREEGHER